MKKLFISLTCFMFLILGINQSVLACHGCQNYNSVISYHYIDNDYHRSIYLKYDPATVSDPIYAAYTKCNNEYYLIFCSDSAFTAHFGGNYGIDIACDSGGFEGRDENKKVFVSKIDYFAGNNSIIMEFNGVSKDLPNYIADVNISNTESILSLDKQLFTLVVKSDGSIFEPPSFDPLSAEYDDNIPVPQIMTKYNVAAGVSAPVITFTNGSKDYNVVIYGRWNSINDITLRQKKLRWVYDYTSLIHGDLECWVTDEDNRSSFENFDFFSDAHFYDTYTTFLNKYPLTERHIINDPTIFEKLTGYNSALYDFTDLYMKMPNNAYSKPDFFFRYYYRDNEQNIHYSRWAHMTFPLIPSGENGFTTPTDQLWKGNLDYQISNKPLTSEQVLDVNTYFDSDQTKYNIVNNQQSYELDEIDWTMSLNNLQSITSVFGEIPVFVSTVFNCFPSWMVQLIGATITILCALAIYHGIRG